MSTYQKNTWGTVIEKVKKCFDLTKFYPLCFCQLLPSALKNAMVEDVDFRRGLPLDCTRFMGIVNSDKVRSLCNSTFYFVDIRIAL